MRSKPSAQQPKCLDRPVAGWEVAALGFISVGAGFGCTVALSGISLAILGVDPGFLYEISNEVLLQGRAIPSPIWRVTVGAVILVLGILAAVWAGFFSGHAVGRIACRYEVICAVLAGMAACGFLQAVSGSPTPSSLLPAIHLNMVLILPFEAAGGWVAMKHKGIARTTKVGMGRGPRPPD